MGVQVTCNMTLAVFSSLSPGLNHGGNVGSLLMNGSKVDQLTLRCF